MIGIASMTVVIDPTIPPRKPMKRDSSSNRRMTSTFFVPKDLSNPISFLLSRTVLDIIREVIAEEATREMTANMIRMTETS